MPAASALPDALLPAAPAAPFAPAMLAVLFTPAKPAPGTPDAPHPAAKSAPDALPAPDVPVSDPAAGPGMPQGSASIHTPRQASKNCRSGPCQSAASSTSSQSMPVRRPSGRYWAAHSHRICSERTPSSPRCRARRRVFGCCQNPTASRISVFISKPPAVRHCRVRPCRTCRPYGDLLCPHRDCISCRGILFSIQPRPQAEPEQGWKRLVTACNELPMHAMDCKGMQWPAMPGSSARQRLPAVRRCRICLPSACTGGLSRRRKGLSGDVLRPHGGLSPVASVWNPPGAGFDSPRLHPGTPAATGWDCLPFCNVFRIVPICPRRPALPDLPALRPHGGLSPAGCRLPPAAAVPGPPPSAYSVVRRQIITNVIT